MDFERFAKVLALTESMSDGEALAAIRSAQRMVQRAGLSFHDVAMAARDGFAQGDAEEIERLSAEIRTLRREIRRLNAELRCNGRSSTPSGPDALAAREIRQLRRAIADLEKERDRLTAGLEAAAARAAAEADRLRAERDEARAALADAEARLLAAETAKQLVLEQAAAVMAMVRERSGTS